VTVDSKTSNLKTFTYIMQSLELLQVPAAVNFISLRLTALDSPAVYEDNAMQIQSFNALLSLLSKERIGCFESLLYSTQSKFSCF